MNKQHSPQHTLINGIAADYVSVNDRGLLYGDGLFETIKLGNGKLCYWHEHYQRLRQSAEKLAIACPDDRQLLDDIKRVLPEQVGRGVIKIILTRGSGQRGYAFDERMLPTRIVQFSEMPEYDSRYYSEGIRAGVSQHRIASSTTLAGIKHLNRLDNVLARASLDKRSQEGIVLNQQGLVTEGCMSNVFFIKHGALHTPALRDAGVDGIIRQQLITLAQAAGMQINIDDYLPQHVLDADEIFFCNSLIGLWPVQQLDDKTYAVNYSKQLASQLEQHEKDHATAL